jgi:uncharacterized protein YebE (UPF0316 family)
MDILSLIDTNLFSWVILPLLIFVSRIFDVSIGTLRIIFVSRGKKYIAPVLGFFEVLIWLIAISQIMQNLNNVLCYVAYAGGYAMGTFVGIRIEEKLALGILVVRIILTEDGCKLKERLHPVVMVLQLLMVMVLTDCQDCVYNIRRKDIDNVVSIKNQCNSKAFYSVEDARTAKEGVFP